MARGRIRSLRPDGPRNRLLSQVPREARWTFVALWCWCDDEGRCADDPELLAADVYPRDQDICSSEVEKDLSALAAAGLLCRYEAEGQRWLHVLGFNEEEGDFCQRPQKPQTSRIPGCENDHSGAQGTLFDAPDQRPYGTPTISIQYPPNTGMACSSSSRGSSSSKTLGQLAPASSSAFAEFWLVYPRKVAKLAAQKAWAKAVGEGADPVEVLAGAARYGQARAGQDPRFTKHPATWLRAGCWMDEAPAPSGTRGRLERGMDLVQRLAEQDRLAAT